MPDHRLIGCRPVPLASYLKALAVLRLVGEQADRNARGFWDGNTFVLRTELDEAALIRFFLHEYEPTPIIAPWNGGSGFYYREGKSKEKDPTTGKRRKTGTRDEPTAATRALEAVEQSKTARLSSYRSAIAIARAAIAGLGLAESPKEEAKGELVDLLRGSLPDNSLDWLDSALFLVGDSPRYPPLLAAGATDGNLDFTKNFLERIGEIFDAATGEGRPQASRALLAALWDTADQGLNKGAIGQFAPAASGGVNTSVGFEGDPFSNPWDLVLALEGVVPFAAAAVRRCGRQAPGGMAYPFTVRMLAVGYDSSTSSDEKDGKNGSTRGEMWLPTWHSAASFPELKTLLSEGRAQVSGRPVRNTVDFARAVSTLGVDRGITAFQRFAFHVRKGSTALATPLERFRVREQPTVRLLDELDAWLDNFRRRATADRAPASARRALGVLEDAIVDLCRRGGADRVQAVLIALGGCERAMARSIRWASDPKNNLSPVPPLSPAWLEEAADGSAELRLAAALGSVVASQRDQYAPVRCHLEPIRARVQQGRLRVEWSPTNDRDVVFSDGDLIGSLNAIVSRRLVLCERWGVDAYPDSAAQPANPADVSAFIEGRTDDARIASLLWAAILIDWPRGDGPFFPTLVEGNAPPALYGLLKLCFAGSAASGDRIPVVPRIHRLAANGDGAEASRAAARRLRASGYGPAVDLVHQAGDPARRSAAAVLFPLDARALASLRRTVLRPTPQPGVNSP